MQAADNHFPNFCITLLEDISDAVCITSPEGKPVYFNAEFKSLIHCETIEEISLAGGLTAIIGENVYSSVICTSPHEIRRQETFIFPLKNKPPVAVALTAKPLLQPDGNLVGTAWYFQNTSVEKRPELYLRLLESFVENTSDAVMITEAEPIDEPGPRIIYINPAFTHITGYSKEEVLGKSPRFLQGPATSRTELAKVRKALETQSRATVEVKNYTKSGKEFWIEFSVVPVPGQNSNVLNYVSIQRETTRKRHIEARLQEKNKELSKALQMNREILEHSLDVICVLNEEQKFVQVSRACERIWGYTPEELTGEVHTKLVYPEDLQITKAMTEKFYAEGTVSDFENRYVHKSGRLVPMMWTASWSEDKKLVYAIGRDISERKAAEAKIRQSEQLYRSLSQNYPNGTISICDRNFQIVLMEGQELDRYYVTSAMLAGRPLHEIFGLRAAEYIKEKLSPTFEGKSLSLELQLSNRYYMCTTVPLPGNGTVEHIMVVTQDISDRKYAEKRLEESYQVQQRLATRMTAILDALPAQVALVNTEGVIIDVNNAWKNFALQNGFRYTRYGIGHTYLHVCDTSGAEEASNVSAGIRDVISGNNQSFSMEYPCHTPTEMRWFKLEVSPMLQTYPTDVVVMHVDITERKQAEESLQNYNLQLQKINYELDQFVYRASHDLRAPLVSIMGLINLSYMEHDEAQKNQYLSLMEKSVRKLDTFIQDIIYYSKNSRTELVLSEIDFQSLVTNIYDNLKYMEEAKSIDFRMDVEPIHGFYTDENRLNVVLHNIVANAIRYHDPAKEQQYIRVGVTKTGSGHVRMAIEDNGQGIAKEHQVRVFEMFYRATEKNVGSGLGLYIVKENLKKLKGRIALESEPGQGTTFTIELPNLPDQEKPAP